MSDNELIQKHFNAFRYAMAPMMEAMFNDLMSIENDKSALKDEVISKFRAWFDTYGCKVAAECFLKHRSGGLDDSAIKAIKDYLEEKKAQLQIYDNTDMNNHDDRVEMISATMEKIFKNEVNH
jgi:hypothetical protein